MDEPTGELATARKDLEALRLEHGETLENLPHGFFRTTAEGRILAANGTLARMLGYESTAALLASVSHVGRQLYADPRRRLDFERELREHGRVSGFEAALRRRDGSTIWCELSARRIGGQDGAAVYEGVAQDVTALKQARDGLLAAHAELERRVRERTLELEAANRALRDEIREREQAERLLRDSEERYRALAQNSRDVIMRFDREGRHLYVNSSVEALTGVPAAAFFGRTHRELGFPEPLIAQWEPAIEKVFHDGQVHRVEFQLPTGVWIDWLLMPEFAVDGTVQCVVTAARDITERKRAEALLQKAHDELEERVARRTEELQRAAELLRESEKLRAIGQLAGGVAHDFNNLLQALLGSVSLLRRRREDGPAFARLLGQIEADVGRGAALSRQLLLFARREVARVESVDLNDVLRAGGLLLSRLVRDNVELCFELSGEALPVRVDRGQIEQVLVNLVLNACDAIAGSGRIVIASGDEAGSAWFDVRDDGQGIPGEHLTRIFEPFFTTKSREKGIGLGLSVVHGIVEAHAGSVDVRSAVGTGSSFRVRLPRGEGTGDGTGDGAAAKGVAAGLAPAACSERVLLVEDETSTRRVVEEMLVSLGYAVTAVDSGERALALPASPACDLLVTDQMQPGIGGAELAPRLRERWPGLAVVVISGYSEDPASTRADGDSVAFLAKPFDLQALAAEARAALARRAPRDPGAAP
jgi:PAS domain S-box-containing protein